MDEILEHKLSALRKKILETILDNKDDVKKWLLDKPISFDSERFSTLFFGDWSRDSKTLLRLDKFLNTKEKPSIIFEEIKKELQRKNSAIYKSNFNPNLFFIFYDKFYELDLGYKYKLVFDFLRDLENDHISGIQILNREKLETNNILRKEIIRVIEIHSKILFNDRLEDYLGTNNFKKMFIKNCVIQKEIQTYYNSKFIDLCYCLDKVVLYPNNLNVNELHNIEKNNILIEINEEHHSSLSDILRNNNLISSSGAKINSFDLTNILDYNGFKFNKEIITNICKVLIKNNDLKNNIMKLYLTDIEKLDTCYVDFIINYKYSINNKFTIYSIFNLINSNNDGEELNINKIIKILFKRGFFDSSDYFDTQKEYDLIKKNGINYILENINLIKLSRLGIESLFFSIDKKYWKEKDNFTIFKIEIENKYLDSVEKLLQDDIIDILIEENNLKNSIFHILKDFNANKFRKNIKKINKYKNLTHPEIPFIIKSYEKFTDIRIIKLLIDEEKFKELEENNTFTKGYLIGYRPLFKSEFDDIMNYEDFGKEYNLI
jgi:hypothetical protein